MRRGRAGAQRRSSLPRVCGRRARVAYPREVVDESRYVIQRPFELEKTVVAERHEATETPRVVTGELDRLLAANNGDTIVNLNLQASRCETGSHGSAAETTLPPSAPPPSKASFD